MQLANIMLRTSSFSTIPVKNVTPAELMILVADNHRHVGGDPVVKLELVKKLKWGKVQDRESDHSPMFLADPSKENGKGEPVMVDGWEETDEVMDIKRSVAIERSRLAHKYGAKKINQLFGNGPLPRLPETFEEAKQAGLTVMNLSGDKFLNPEANMEAEPA